VEGLNDITGNSFALFSSIDKVYLRDLAKDIGVSVEESEEETDKVLDSFKA
jgi:hypothetical protein